MANKEHIALLLESISENNSCKMWNKWLNSKFSEEPEFICNLDYSNLYLKDMRYINLRNASLRHTRFDGSKLTCANLRGANLENAHFDAAETQIVDFSRANLNNAYFFRADLWASTFIESSLIGANFKDANLTECCFRNANLINVRFLETAKIIGANFYGVKINVSYKNAIEGMYKKLLTSIKWGEELPPLQSWEEEC